MLFFKAQGNAALGILAHPGANMHHNTLNATDKMKSGDK